MAYSTVSPASAHTGGNFIATAIHGFSDRVKRQRMYRKTLNELRRLNARELNDLGLNRAMLKQVSWKAACDDQARGFRR